MTFPENKKAASRYGRQLFVIFIMFISAIDIPIDILILITITILITIPIPSPVVLAGAALRAWRIWISFSGSAFL